jgi:hypothetical protein
MEHALGDSPSLIKRAQRHIGNAGHQKADTRLPNEPVVVERLQRNPIQINNLRR